MKNKTSKKFFKKLGQAQWTICRDEIDETFIDYFYKMNRKHRRKISHCMSGNAWELFYELEAKMGIESIEEKEIIKKEKVEKKEATLQEALHLLNKTFTLNKNVKERAYDTYEDYCPECGGYGDHDNSQCWNCFGSYYYTEVYYGLRDSEYSRKTANIITAIKLIRDNRLPIKYGKNDDIIYFERCGHQVSFHDPKNIISCKPFNGKWIGIKNTKIPFIYKK